MPSKISHVLPNKQPLDFQSLKELPESFKWAPLDNQNGPSDHDSVPIIDLLDPKAEQSIGLACKSWGVFQVINHGVPKTLLDKIEKSGKTLFSLPIQQKLKAARSPNGVTGYGPARISSFFPKRMWSEGFTIFGSPIQHASQLWPNDYGTFCDIIEEYQKEMKLLAGKLMCLILGSLGISTQDMKRVASQQNGYIDPFNGSNGAIQLNSYPACPDPNQAMGLAAHTDSTLLTILHQSNTCGLQVLRAGSWVMVPPISGGLVINIGDLLHILSNGIYPSVCHRAVVNRAEHRLSVAYLYGPAPEARIQPFLTRDSGPSLYRPVTWSEYLGIKAKHFDKTLPLIRLNYNNEKNNDNDKDNDNNNSGLISGLRRLIKLKQKVLTLIIMPKSILPWLNQEWTRLVNICHFCWYFYIFLRG